MRTPKLKQANKEVQGPEETKTIENGQQHSDVLHQKIFIWSENM